MAQAVDRRSTYRRGDDLYRKSIAEVRDYAIFMTDARGNVINWNLGAAHILGYTEEEILGENAALFFTPQDRARGEPDRELATAEMEGRAEDERWHLRRDGTRFWASGVVTPVRDDDGRLLGFTKVMRDMTERRRIEEERDRFFNLSMDMLCIAELDGYLKRINPAFERTLGYTAEELLARPIFDLIHPDDRSTTVNEYCRLAQGKPTTLMENRVRCKDGSFKWLAWSYFPVPHEGIAYGVGRDITPIKQAHEMLRSRAEEMEAANRIKDEFLATLSHELRTPLTSMLGWSRLLRSGQLDEEGRGRAIQIIERNAESQSKLIEDLLDVSRIITGKLKVELQPVTVPLLVESVVNSLRPSAEAKTLQLITAIDHTAGPVLGDPTRLQQIVSNILSNAIKFTPSGGQIELRLDRSNSHARLQIADTGIGINPDVLPHIFERFSQADSSSRRSHSGLGLGLAIVHHLVQQHGGTVRAESEGEGKGSVFTVDLPLAPTDVSRGSSGPIGLSRGASVEMFHEGDLSTRRSLKGLKVLLIEDESDTRDLLRTIVEGCGALVIAVSSGGAAMAAVTEFTPDVIVSDVGLPGENGYDLIERIRELDPSAGGTIPAVALTAYAAPRNRRRALLAGFHTHLAKPVEPDELVAVVASLAAKQTNHWQRDSTAE
jgi:PAS domain S-box-containing protein